MVSINATLVFQVIQLLVLIFILNRIMFRPIMNLITERDSFFEKSKLDLKNMEREVEHLKEVFIAREQDTKTKASHQGMELKNAAMKEMKELLEESSESAAAIKSEAMQRAQEQLEKTRPLLEEEAKILADDIVGGIIGRRLAA